VFNASPLVLASMCVIAGAVELAFATARFLARPLAPPPAPELGPAVTLSAAEVWEAAAAPYRDVA
jgi:hypothetical protein